MIMLKLLSFRIFIYIRIFIYKSYTMDLQTRKIEFVQEFLKLQDEEAVARLERLLEKEKKTDNVKEVRPMTKKELNQRIDQSESDFKNNRFKTTSELLSKY